ncbi:carboxypeptidase regulatory-like domain-containing protein [Bacteroidota bacterium]
MASIKGNVGGSSRPIRDVDVTLKKVLAGIVKNTKTDSSGNYKLIGLNAGSYELELSKISIIPGEDSISGRILINSSPKKGLNVDLFDSNGAKIGTSVTDKLGNYSFNGLPVGEIRKVVNLPNLELSVG